MFRSLFVAMIGIFAVAASGTAVAQQPADARSADETPAPEIVWRGWDDSLFPAARAQKRFVLLDLNARWCHWCHFMERRTYAHPVVRRIIDAGFIAVRVDQDANPDLASRYGDWGWPATIVFDHDGNEVAKFQGFLRPSLMSNILYTILHHPDQVPALPPRAEVARSPNPFLTQAQRDAILKVMADSYDVEHAGWGKRLKFMQPEVVEYAVERARNGDKQMERRVRETLNAALSLIDPVWGGVYQYSHKRDWSAPHFEKLMWFQAQTLRLYSRAYALFGDARYRQAAKAIHGYLTTHLMSPDGSFYTSQDADVDAEILGEHFYKLDAVERMKAAKAPPVDTNRYARENGWAISGLAAYYGLSGDEAALDQARRAAEWVLTNRQIEGGGFLHGEKDRGGPFLSDTLAMAQGLFDLYSATGDTRWLRQAAAAGDFMEEHFRHDVAGYVTTAKPAAAGGAFADPYLNIEENIRLARFANLMHRTFGKQRFRSMAAHAMGYLTTDTVALKRRFLVGIVLADDELAMEPAHITIVGPKDNSMALSLHRAALRLPIATKRIDWWDPAGPPMANPDVTYPALEKPAAFACANQICSLPVFAASELETAVAKTMKQRVTRRVVQ